MLANKDTYPPYGWS